MLEFDLLQIANTILLWCVDHERLRACFRHIASSRNVFAMIVKTSDSPVATIRNPRMSRRQFPRTSNRSLMISRCIVVSTARVILRDSFPLRRVELPISNVRLVFRQPCQVELCRVPIPLHHCPSCGFSPGSYIDAHLSELLNPCDTRYPLCRRDLDLPTVARSNHEYFAASAVREHHEEQPSGHHVPI